METLAPILNWPTSCEYKDALNGEVPLRAVRKVGFVQAVLSRQSHRKRGPVLFRRGDANCSTMANNDFLGDIKS
jgi:hypothetical protein